MYDIYSFDWNQKQSGLIGVGKVNIDTNNELTSQ